MIADVLQALALATGGVAPTSQVDATMTRGMNAAAMDAMPTASSLAVMTPDVISPPGPTRPERPCPVKWINGGRVLAASSSRRTVARRTPRPPMRVAPRMLPMATASG